MSLTPNQARFWCWAWLGVSVVSALMENRLGAATCLIVSAIFLVGGAVLRRLDNTTQTQGEAK